MNLPARVVLAGEAPRLPELADEFTDVGGARRSQPLKGACNLPLEQRVVSSSAIMLEMRDSWTDERLDDFRGDVNRRFDEVDRRFEEVGRRFDRVEADICDLRVEMNSRFDSLQRTLLQIAGGTITALIAGFAGIIVTQL